MQCWLPLLLRLWGSDREPGWVVGDSLWVVPPYLYYTSIHQR